MGSLRRFVLACLAVLPTVVDAAINSADHANHAAAMARQARFQRTGKLARRQEDPDDAADYTCTANRGCKIGCCGPL